MFRGVSIILFLNKTDLLTKKVCSGESDVRTYFPQFSGDPRNLADVQAFILHMFTSVKRDPRKPLFHHFTTAVDTENIKVVFNAVKDTILHRNLESLMLAWHLVCVRSELVLVTFLCVLEFKKLLAWFCVFLTIWSSVGSRAVIIELYLKMFPLFFECWMSLVELDYCQYYQQVCRDNCSVATLL